MSATSEGYTGPYPTVPATPSATHAVESSAGSTAEPPEVDTEGHSELESDSPGASTEAAQGSTATPPTVDTEGHSEIETPAPGGSPEASAGYSGAEPSVDATPEVETLPQEEAAHPGGEAAEGSTKALPNVAVAEPHSDVEPLSPHGSGSGETSG